MKAKERNQWYYKILESRGFDLQRNFFELTWSEGWELCRLAETMQVKSVNGKSPARTLWDRAKEGRPF